jgi:hypothetical protein
MYVLAMSVQESEWFETFTDVIEVKVGPRGAYQRL